ncbi:MAG TPA: hypothetical protein VFM55_19165 [Micromonosporaceae bacterium]|nr:hypothetical protein [Micromonosporaceae bacterium]
MSRVVISKAEPTHSQGQVTDVVIEITGSQPEHPDLKQAAEFFHDEAQVIHKALSAALPGGTLDALFAVMAADKASRFRVAYGIPAGGS